MIYPFTLWAPQHLEESAVLLGWESRGKGRPWKPLPFPDTQLGRVPNAMLSKFTHSDKTSTQDASPSMRSGSLVTQ